MRNESPKSRIPPSKPSESMKSLTRGKALVVLGLLVASAPHASDGASTAPSPRLETRVPFEPTAFPSADRTHLFYELHIRNASSVPVILRRIEVFDAARATSEPIAA